MTFFNTTNPYLDPGAPDVDGQIPTQHQTSYAQQRDQWTDVQFQDQRLDLPTEIHPHGLEALSAAALYSPPEANMVPRTVSSHSGQYDTTFDQTSPNHNSDYHGNSPGVAMAASNNLNFLLNPSSSIDSPIDPSLMSPTTSALPSQTGESGAARKVANRKGSDGEVESEHKVAYLLRHFSESPGSWSVK